MFNDPLFSNNAVDEYLEKPVKAARMSLEMNLRGTKEDENQKKECQMCQKNHVLGTYFKYKHLEVDETKRFLIKIKLCFACYDVISKKYSRRNYPKRRKCSTCKEQHPTGLHGLQAKKKKVTQKIK